MSKDLEGMPLAEDNGFVSTLNKTGYMTSSLDPYSQAFVDFSAKQRALEIGAAYGVASLRALAQGARLLCNDLEAEHLEVLKRKAQKNLGPGAELSCIVGDFVEVLDQADLMASFKAILCCRVLHFFEPQKIETALALLSRLLAPGGRLFIVNETCYLKNLQSFIPIYEKRLETQPIFSGHMTDVQAFAPDRGENLPQMMTFLDEATLRHLASTHQLKIIQCGTFARTEFPEDLQLDGRESVGLIAEKV